MLRANFRESFKYLLGILFSLPALFATNIRYEINNTEPPLVFLVHALGLHQHSPALAVRFNKGVVIPVFIAFYHAQGIHNSGFDVVFYWRTTLYEIPELISQTVKKKTCAGLSMSLSSLRLTEPIPVAHRALQQVLTHSTRLAF